MTRVLQIVVFGTALLCSTPFPGRAAEPTTETAEQDSKTLYGLVADVRKLLHSLNDKSNETRFNANQDAWEQYRSTQALFIAGMVSRDESLYRRSYFQTYNQLTQERITLLKGVLELSIGY